VTRTTFRRQGYCSSGFGYMMRLRLVYVEERLHISRARCRPLLGNLQQWSDLEVSRRDVPVGAAFFGDGAEVLTEVLHGGAAEEPVAVVDLVDDEAGFENDNVRLRMADSSSLFARADVWSSRLVFGWCRGSAGGGARG
jgi:hypothetical protein